MLYYHFKSKAGLYVEVLRDMFQAVAARMGDAAATRADPADRIKALVEAIAREAEARPHFPPIWLREIAEGGTHVDKDTMAIIARVLGHVAAAVQDGVAAKRFKPANPLFVQLGIVGPLLMFFATAPMRRRAPQQLAFAANLTTEQIIAHVQRVALVVPGRKVCMRAVLSICVAAGLAVSAAACRGDAADAPRASGYVEATEVRVAAEAGGRVLEMMADEGRQVAAGDVLARLDTGDVEIALRRAEADREQAAAQLHLLQAGARREDVRQSQAQADTARSEAAAVEAELKAANDDLQRFEALLAANAGSRKQRDDAAARVSVATARRRAAEDRVRAAEQAVAEAAGGRQARGNRGGRSACRLG